MPSRAPFVLPLLLLLLGVSRSAAAPAQPADSSGTAGCPPLKFTAKDVPEKASGGGGPTPLLEPLTPVRSSARAKTRPWCAAPAGASKR